MDNKAAAGWVIEEVAVFLASFPTREELLAYHPSARAVERFNALLAKSKAGSVSAEEEWKLDQFEHIEMLIQSVKARLRSGKRDCTLADLEWS